MQNVSREIQEKNKKLFNFELILIKIIKKLKKHEEIFKKIKGKNAGFTYLKNFVFDFYNLFDVNCLNVTCFDKQDEPDGKFFICEPQEIKKFKKDEYKEAFDYNTEKLKTNPEIITIQYYLQDSSTLEKIKSKLNESDSANYKKAIDLKTYDSETTIADFSENLVFKRQNYKLDSFIIFNKEPKENVKDKSNCVALLNLKDNKVLYNGNLKFKSDSDSKSDSKSNSSEKCDDFISFNWSLKSFNFKLSDENQSKDFFNNYLIVFIYVKDFNEKTDKIHQLKSRSMELGNFDSFNSISTSFLSKQKSLSSSLPSSLPSLSSKSTNNTFDLSESSLLPSLSSRSSKKSNNTLSLSRSSPLPELITSNSEEKYYLRLPSPGRKKLKSSQKSSSSSVHTSGYTEQMQSKSKSKSNSSRTSFIPSNMTTLESSDSYKSSLLKDNKFNRLPPQSISNLKSKCNKKISLYFYENSCYIDSLLVALFHNYNEFVFNYFVDADIQQYPFLSQEIQTKLNNIAIIIKEELINLILLISGKKNEPRNIAPNTNNQKTTSFKLRTLIKDYLNTRYSDNRSNKYVKEELDFDDVIYALNEIFLFKKINIYDKKDFYLLDDFKLGEEVKYINGMPGYNEDINIYINKYYNKKIGLFKLLLVKINRFTNTSKLSNIVYPSETIINNDNIVYLRSIIIFVPSLRHYICLFKCGDFWYKYNNLATENDVEKTVSYFGRYIDVISNEEYMRNMAGIVYY